MQLALKSPFRQAWCGVWTKAIWSWDQYSIWDLQTLGFTESMWTLDVSRLTKSHPFWTQQGSESSTHRQGTLLVTQLKLCNSWLFMVHRIFQTRRDPSVSTTESMTLKLTPKLSILTSLARTLLSHTLPHLQMPTRAISSMNLTSQSELYLSKVTGSMLLKSTESGFSQTLSGLDKAKWSRDRTFPDGPTTSLLGSTVKTHNLQR
jgi:putative component of membrane protein insertase Oxa1/YidC/SpoIIIJ protein YidD